tara:strand:+ start:2812 stop:3060 length:249 start_codon:yes stop_codon:yes gene_type:complete
MSYFVYILHSEKLDCFYIGSSQEVESRLKDHLTNHKEFTAKSKDWKVVYTEQFPTKTLAILKEKKIKSWKSKIMIKRLIDSQ